MELHNRREFLKSAAVGSALLTSGELFAADPVKGRVTAGGKPLAGVVVTDGLQCAETKALYGWYPKTGERKERIATGAPYIASATVAGYALERYFYWKFVEEARATRMGAWWDRKGENEIDLVCDDEEAGSLAFHEIKMDAKRLDPEALRFRTQAFFAKNPELWSRTSACSGLSLADL